MNKLTLKHIKRFIEENKDKLKIKQFSNYAGETYIEPRFMPCEYTKAQRMIGTKKQGYQYFELEEENIVGFSIFCHKDNYELGINKKISNCCANFVIARNNKGE